MSDQRNGIERDDPSRLSTAALVRLRADGELTEGEAEELSRRTDGASQERGVAFERALRERVGRVMGGASAPAGLRERIESAMRDEADAEAPAPIARRERSFWSSGAGRGLALLAAVLALAAGVTVIVQQAPGPAADGAVARALLATAGRLQAEHTGCVRDEAYFASKMTAPPAGGASSRVSDLLSGAPARLRLDEAGYVLKGLGPCDLEGDAVHLVYEPPAGMAASRLPASLFIQRRAPGSAQDLEEGVVYVSNELGNGCMLRVWRDGDLVYYLVTACPIALDEAARVYDLPERLVRL